MEFVLNETLPDPRVSGEGAFAGPVLLAIDDREESRGAVITALALARKRDAHLRVLSVVEPSRQMESSAPRSARGVTNIRRNRIHAVSRRLAGVDDAFAEAEVEVREGCAVQAIVTAAEECDASSIVLGLRMPADI